MPEEAVGRNEIVHLEVSARQHVRGQEVAGAEDRRRLEGRLRQRGVAGDTIPTPRQNDRD